MGYKINHNQLVRLNTGVTKIHALPVNLPTYACAYTFIKIYFHVLIMRNTKVSMREIHGSFYSFFPAVTITVLGPYP